MKAPFFRDVDWLAVSERRAPPPFDAPTSRCCGASSTRSIRSSEADPCLDSPEDSYALEVYMQLLARDSSPELPIELRADGSMYSINEKAWERRASSIPMGELPALSSRVELS
jgi:hypothetical protein